MQKVYFQKKFDKFKSDIKNTWQTIKEILNRTRTQQNLPDAFLIDNEMTGDPSIIADKFNNLFANVGRRLSEQLTTPDNVNIQKLFTKSGSTKYVFLSDIGRSCHGSTKQFKTKT